MGSRVFDYLRRVLNKCVDLEGKQTRRPDATKACRLPKAWTAFYGSCDSEEFYNFEFTAHFYQGATLTELKLPFWELRLRETCQTQLVAHSTEA